MSATMAIRMRASERPGLLWALALRPFLGAATFSYSLSSRSASGRRSAAMTWCRAPRTGNRRARWCAGRDYAASRTTGA
ncbi:hypothetical protein FRZ03_34815 [Streptomyces misionensis]|uniref:Uncharacterized protein n=1 Tax=Streptomyces misionensis TaxID=67331 RepID=A0A5C6IQW1_9ACTN|nr:hypothetical protein FRZ03_34815 [Streptomyces misionensis]